MVWELLVISGLGIFIYHKFGKKKHNNDTYTNNTIYSTPIRKRRDYTEINRVLFGKYITYPYDTDYFEFECNTDKIPASNSIRQAIWILNKQNPPVHLRASCSICDYGNGTYLHRWMVCCENYEDLMFREKFVCAIYDEYLKGRILV